MTVTPPIGLFRKSVAFRKTTPVADDSGGEADVWSTFLTTRGYLKKLNGNRTLEAGELVMNSTYELWVRFQSALAAEVKPSLRAIIDGKNYTCHDAEVIAERNSYYKFIVKAI